VVGSDGTLSILVIDDEESYREALMAGLTQEGFAVKLAKDGLEGLRKFEEQLPDLVLLDLLLPGMNGTEVCRHMRGIAAVPIIMVSALDAEVDVVLGLELGASDYVTKPFRLRELVARIHGVLRRVAPTVPNRWVASPVQHEVITAGSVRMDTGRREVTVVGCCVHLSRKEYDLLALLLSPPNQVRTREELIELLWSDRDLSDTRTLDTHVRRLRMKLEDDPKDPCRLVTVRGVGFRFDDECCNSEAIEVATRLTSTSR
jgi:two-component system, OmpR family, response regulator RegX3